MNKHVVITGGTRGIGFGLVQAFLALGYSVSFSGTRPITISHAEEALCRENLPNNFKGFICSVEYVKDIKDLYTNAVKTFGPISIWINNAAIFQPKKPFTEFTDRQILRVFKVNVASVMNACRIVQPLMHAQGYGAIYNMEGFGSDGKIMVNRTLYGTSKRALRYFTRSFALETKDSPVQICTISPGLVATDMLREAIPEESSKHNGYPGVYRILTYPPDIVTRYLAKRIDRNKRHGAHIVWLSKRRILFRFISAPLRMGLGSDR